MMLLAICLCNCTILTLRNVKCLRCFPYRHTTLHLTDGCLHAQWVPLPPNPGSHNFRHFYCGTGWGSLEAPLTYTEKCYRVCSSISSAPTSILLHRYQEVNKLIISNHTGSLWLNVATNWLGVVWNDKVRRKIDCLLSESDNRRCPLIDELRYCRRFPGLAADSPGLAAVSHASRVS